METIIDDPCPYCEGDGYIKLGDTDDLGMMPIKTCPKCQGTGLLTKEYPEQDEVSEEGRGT